MNSRLSSDIIKAEARNLGFFACGIAKAEPVDNSYALMFKNWLSRKGHADMEYMSNNTDKRLDPRLIMDGLKSIVCVALNYAPSQTLPKEELQFATYALGHDYHDIVKRKLHTLAENLGITHYRAFCDTAPVLEQYWATKAGIGWIGRNQQLIIPHAGSMFFLGEMFIDMELEYDKPVKSRCGNCHACIDACPTKALECINIASGAKAVENNTMLNASLCLSYQTIENKNDIPVEIAEKIGICIYGCDICLNACPWNRFATPTNEELLQPKEELLQMTREKWATLTMEEYRKLFKGSAVKRARYDKLMRNVCAALELKIKR